MSGVLVCTVQNHYVSRPVEPENDEVELLEQEQGK